MRIAMFAPLLGVEATGQSIAVANTASRLSSAGHTVTILSTDCGYQGRQVREFVAVAPEVSLRIFPVRGRLNRRLYRSRPLEDWVAAHVQDFDLLDVHGIWSTSAIPVVKTFADHGKPYMLTPHGTMTRFDWEKGAFRRRLFFYLGFGRVWRNADALRFLSQGELDDSFYPPNGLSIVIPNGVDLEAPATTDVRLAARLKLGIPADASVLLFLGRLARQKGVKEILAAFEAASNEDPGLFLVLAGPAQEAYGEETLALVRTSPRRDRILVSGAVGSQVKATYFRAADAFVNLSHSEGMSLALLEALSYGLPVILTKNSNLDHMSDYGVGILTTHIPEQASQAILRIMQDRGFREHAKVQARLLVREKFAWAIVIPELIALYQKLAKKQIRGKR